IKQTGWPVEVRELIVKKDLHGEALTSAEGKLMLEAAQGLERLVALDERGKNLSSPELAQTLGRWQDDGAGSVGFAIGGAEGLWQPVREQAHLLLSFGRLTWPHML